MENITKKIIEEKDKVTTIVKKEPAEGGSTSSVVEQTPEKICMQVSGEILINKAN